MTSSAVVSREEILSAFSADSEFTDPEVFEMLKEYVVLLPEVIGEERMGQPVTIDSVCETGYRFLLLVLYEGCEYRFDDILGAIGIIRNYPAYARERGYTDDTFLFDPEMRLIQPLQELYRQKRLTLADIARQQPGFYLPW